MTDEERELKRIQIEEAVFNSFMSQVRNMPEEEWRYFALGCAERLIIGVMMSKRCDMMHHDYGRHREA